jgi:hypothetical protein
MFKFLLCTFILIYIASGCGGAKTESGGYVATKPVAWKEKVTTQDVPSWGSTTRLNLPVALSDIVLGESGGIGAFGAHEGGHVEGLNHIWLPTKTGTTINSWADGEVTKIEDMGDRGTGDGRHEYFITITYADGLVGKHLDVDTPLVIVGSIVKEGDPVAKGPSAEFLLVDNNRTDGERTGANSGSPVSPFDYLKDDVKAAFIAKRNAEVVEPFFKKGLSAGSDRPWEPYLTNKMLFHADNKNTFLGEWILVSKSWDTVDPLYYDVMTIFDVTNDYGHFQKAEFMDHDWTLTGNKNHTEASWIAEDGPNHVIFYLKFSGTYYGIYVVNEADGRAKLTLQWQKDSYPTVITSKAAVYRERDAIYLGGDVIRLGLTKKETTNP